MLLIIDPLLHTPTLTNWKGLVFFKLILKNFELSKIPIYIQRSLVQRYQLLLDLKNPRPIALVKTITEIVPNIRSIVHVKQTISYLFRNRIQNPGCYHTVTTNLSTVKKVICRRTWDNSLEKTNFILYRKRHEHGMIPCVVIRPR